MVGPRARGFSQSSAPGARSTAVKLAERLAVSRDVFISFSKANREWAAWIAWTVSMSCRAWLSSTEHYD